MGCVPQASRFGVLVLKRGVSPLGTTATAKSSPTTGGRESRPSVGRKKMMRKLSMMGGGGARRQRRVWTRGQQVGGIATFFLLPNRRQRSTRSGIFVISPHLYTVCSNTAPWFKCTPPRGFLEGGEGSQATPPEAPRCTPTAGGALALRGWSVRAGPAVSKRPRGTRPQGRRPLGPMDLSGPSHAWRTRV